jgi:hypothetical protein
MFRRRASAGVVSGFLCPECKRDLRSADALVKHYQAAHSREHRNLSAHQSLQRERNGGFVAFMLIVHRGSGTVPALPAEITSLIYEFATSFVWARYAAIRRPDDFVKGRLLNKDELKQNMLCWQSEAIKRSLIDLGVHPRLRLRTGSSMVDCSAENMVDLGQVRTW